MEVLLWLTIICQIVNGTQNTVSYPAYAAAFAVGNYVGMVIEDKLAIGTLVIRIILPKNAEPLFKSLQNSGYGVTYVDDHGATGPVFLIYTVVMRKELDHVIRIIEATAPGSFFTVEELRSVQQGIFPVRNTRRQAASSESRSDFFFESISHPGR